LGEENACIYGFALPSAHCIWSACSDRDSIRILAFSETARPGVRDAGRHMTEKDQWQLGSVLPLD